MAFDFKKEYREFYLPKNRPEIVTVPPANYIAVRGSGDPNAEGGAYKQAIGVLYAVSDELHQLFVKARSCEAFDVLVDALGVLLAVAGLHLLTAVFLRRKRKKTVSSDGDAVDALVLSAFSSFVTGAPLKDFPTDEQFGAFAAALRGLGAAI